MKCEGAEVLGQKRLEDSSTSPIRWLSGPYNRFFAANRDVRAENRIAGGRMIRVVDSLKEVVQDTLQQHKAKSIAFARVKSMHVWTLNDGIEELQKIVVDGIHKFKAAVKEGEAAEQVIESLRANNTALEAKLKKIENTLPRADLDSQKMEGSLTAKIHVLQSELKNRENSLESRNNEVKNLKSKIDVLGMQVSQLEFAIEQAAADAERTEQLTESFKATIAALEIQLRQTEEIVRGKESTIKSLQQALAAQMQDIDKQINDLESRLRNRNADLLRSL